jgi:hypothetical protein
VRAILYFGDGYELSKTMVTLRPRLGVDALAAAMAWGRSLAFARAIDLTLAGYSRADIWGRG